MNYHIEGEITRVTLDCDKRVVSIRLQPTSDFVRKEGDVEKVILVGEGLESVVPYAVKDEFERLDFKIPCASRFADFLLTCKMNRCRVRIEVEVSMTTMVKNDRAVYKLGSIKISRVSVV